MTTQHTPEPWKYGVRRDGSIWLSLGDPKVAGAAHYQGDFVGTEADARLVIAAPGTKAELSRLQHVNAELLAALSNLLAVSEGEGGTRFHAGNIACAAIAKATGAA